MFSCFCREVWNCVLVSECVNWMAKQWNPPLTTQTNVFMIYLTWMFRIISIMQRHGGALQWRTYTWILMNLNKRFFILFQLDLQLQDESGGDISSFITNGEWELLGKYAPHAWKICAVSCARGIFSQIRVHTTLTQVLY